MIFLVKFLNISISVNANGEGHILRIGIADPTSSGLRGNCCCLLMC